MDKVVYVIFGLLAGYMISDVIRALPALNRDRSNNTRSWLNVIDLLVPKWLISGLIVVGLVISAIGGAQIYLTIDTHNFQRCQARHDAAYDTVQRERTESSLDLTRQRFAYDSTITALLTPGNNKSDLRATQKALKKYVDSANDYFKIVDKNPYPESTIQLCGNPKG